MPRQDVARKVDIEVMNKEEVNAEDFTGHKETGYNWRDEDHAKEELQSHSEGQWEQKWPVDIYQTGSSLCLRYIITDAWGIEQRQ